MGEMRPSINFHYSKKNLVALYRILEDETVDEEDREFAKELIEKLENELDDENEEKIKDGEEIE